jgi:hypothetical protein
MNARKARRLRQVRAELVAMGAQPPRKLRRLVPWLRQVGRR